jgi:hypothetical protein
MAQNERIQELEARVAELEKASENAYYRGIAQVLLLVDTQLTPFWAEVAELEHIMGIIEGVSRGNVPTVAFCSEMALKLGDCLNRADKLNREISASTRLDSDFFDLSAGQDYRVACIDITSGLDPSGKQLKKLIQERDAIRDILNLARQQRNSPKAERDASIVAAFNMLIGQGMDDKKAYYLLSQQYEGMRPTAVKKVIQRKRDISLLSLNE